MFTLDHFPGRTSVINGKEYLFFSGYSYLGIAHVPEFINLVKEGMDTYGLLFPSSRISNTRLTIFEEIEALLSQLTSQDETVIYSSGFLAGRAVVDWLSKQSVQSFIVPGTHPALQNNSAKALREDWQNHLHELLHENDSEHYVLLFDSVNPLTASIHEFSFLKDIPDKKITCVIDDSHGIGLLGEKGEGIGGLLPQLANVDYIITYSLSKAFHINGGAVSCNKKTALSLRLSSFYTGSTSINPSLCYAFVNGQYIYNRQRKKLYEGVVLFQKQSGDHPGIHFHPQLPVIVLEPEFDAEYFLPKNIIISSFSYPDPSGSKINRIVLNALHTEEDIKAITATLTES